MGEELTNIVAYRDDLERDLADVIEADPELACDDCGDEVAVGEGVKIDDERVCSGCAEQMMDLPEGWMCGFIKYNRDLGLPPATDVEIRSEGVSA